MSPASSSCNSSSGRLAADPGCLRPPLVGGRRLGPFEEVAAPCVVAEEEPSITRIIEGCHQGGGSSNLLLPFIESAEKALTPRLTCIIVDSEGQLSGIAPAEGRRMNGGWHSPFRVERLMRKTEGAWQQCAPEIEANAHCASQPHPSEPAEGGQKAHSVQPGCTGGRNMAVRCVLWQHKTGACRRPGQCPNAQFRLVSNSLCCCRDGAPCMAHAAAPCLRLTHSVAAAGAAGIGGGHSGVAGPIPSKKESVGGLGAAACTGGRGSLACKK